MNRRIPILASLGLAALLFSTPAQAEPPKIQIALLLDTSNSMDGLIAQAKGELWRIVNRVAKARLKGEDAVLEVALYEYGKSSIASGEGHLRQVLGFTTDLDGLSEELFALKTNGGEEYCGMAIDRATNGLPWSARRTDYKAIFIAGNERFTQGPVEYKGAIDRAIKKGIMVNTIHCGSDRDGVRGKWKDAAARSDGRYMVIDQSSRQKHIPSPYDKEIVDLGQKLNQTYIGYGRRGRRYKERQMVQDSNASQMGMGSMMSRSYSKGGRAYSNESWDLVDAIKKKKVKSLGKLKKEELPEEMRNMDGKEREAYVQKKSKERAAIQAKIKELKKKRDAFVSKARRKEKDKSTFDKAVLEAIDTQMSDLGYDFQ